MRHAGVFALGALLLAATPAAGQATTEALTAALIDRHVVPRYAEFAASTEALAHAVDTTCEGEPTVGAGPDLATAFRVAWLSWASVRHVTTGPVTYFDRSFRIQFWPDTRNRTAKALAALLDRPDVATLSVDAVAEASVAVQGFPALERLLYRQGVEEVGAGLDVPTCAVMRAVSHHLSRMAADIAMEWTDAPVDFRGKMLTPGTVTSPFAARTESLAALVTGSVSTLEGITRLRLSRPLGGGLETARPRRGEAWRSALSLDLIRAEIASVQGLYLADGAGIDAALRDMGRGDLADLAKRGFSTTIATVDSIAGPLAVAVADPVERPKVETLVLQVSALQGLLVQDIAPALGVTAGFNALDGD